MVFQFTHPGRGATGSYSSFFSGCGVSIHAPREGCDLSVKDLALRILVFQFTHPGRGATDEAREGVIAHRVSIHAPREGCDIGHPNFDALCSFVSIHAPREGCDKLPPSTTSADQRFNSRTPGGVRHISNFSTSFLIHVSIHAPREGCDRSSRGDNALVAMFQFTHPGRGATR